MREIDESLDKAVRAGDVEVVKSLLDQGADPNAEIIQDVYRKVPVTHHVFTAFPPPEGAALEIVRSLVGAGADINARCGNNTLLMLAAYPRYISVVEWLIEHGADTELMNHKGQTAFRYIKDQNNFDFAEVLGLLAISSIDGRRWLRFENGQEWLTGGYVKFMTERRTRTAPERWLSGRYAEFIGQMQAVSLDSRVVLEGNSVRGNFWGMLDLIQPQSGVGRNDFPPDWSVKENLLLFEGPHPEWTTLEDIVRKASKKWGDSVADKNKYTMSVVSYRTNPIGNGLIAFFWPRE